MVQLSQIEWSNCLWDIWTVQSELHGCGTGWSRDWDVWVDASWDIGEKETECVQERSRIRESREKMTYREERGKKLQKIGEIGRERRDKEEDRGEG